MPANNISGTPFGTLFGRPVIPTQAAEAPTQPGDIMLCDWNQYLIASKGGGVRSDTSMHVYFDTDEMALRFVLRIGGTPWFESPVTSRVGNFNQSAFVTLAQRS